MILVVGGTGRLGRQVVAGLLAQGHRVRVLSRHAFTSRHPELAGAELVTGDVREPTSLVDAVAGVETVVSAVHGFADPGGGTPETVDRNGNRHLVEAAERAGAAVVLVSVIGVSPTSPMELFRMKWAAEEALRESSVPWTVVRASAFAETWAHIVASTAGRSGRPVVFGRGDNPLNFVMVADVAAAVVRAATDPSLRGQVVEVGGPENLTLSELAGRVQQAHGWSGPPRHVPRALLRALGNALAGIRPALARELRAAVALDTMDGRFDPTTSHAEHPWLPCSPLTFEGPAM